MNARLATALALGLGASLYAPAADACGGFFCANQPVIQTGEQIIFSVDHTTEVTHAIININYSGAAAEFAWLLPLQVNPSNIDVGPAQAFVVSDQLTRPSFQITRFETRGICGPNDVFLAGAAEDSAARAGGMAPPNADPGVNVLQQSNVGPYATVVLEGTDPAAVRRWLVDNNYRVTDQMMEAVVPYIAQGDVLLALKLRKDNDAGDIQPIWLELPQAEACIPLRLTAIAAQADMDVTAVVLSDRGRAIPQNYFHVTPNLAKIDWLRGGSNYRQVIGEAADEAGGNAFTTEFSGSAEIFREQLYRDGQYDVARLRQQTDLGRLLDEISNQGLRFRTELRSIMSRHFPEVTNCQGCPSRQFYGRTIDPNAFVNDLVARIIEPEQKMQQLFDRYEHVTRLYTLISPEEMSIDPLFNFDARLPNINNRHEATMVQHCGVGGSPGSAGIEIVLDDGTVIEFENGFGGDRAALDAMPAAARIEQLAEGTLVTDNRGKIDDLLGKHNDVNGLGGCGCAYSERGSHGGLVSLAALGLLGLALATRRR